MMWCHRPVSKKSSYCVYNYILELTKKELSNIFLLKNYLVSNKEFILKKNIFNEIVN